MNRSLPTSASSVPLMRPLLPTLDELSPYLERIDASRWYTNFGPLVQLLEERLARHFRVGPQNLVVVANGTTALSAALLAVGAKPGSKCLLPSWTFVATAAAAWAANLVPHFVDVTPETWMPDPVALRRRKDLGDVGAAIIVAPFGTPFETAAWDAFWEETGIPVIIDGAACFDTIATIAASRPGRVPTIVSLHATKVLGVGEGGLVVSTDEAIVHRIRQVCNFGIWGSPQEQILGYNGKLSEYHAAVGLAGLDSWPARRQALLARTNRYKTELSPLKGVTNLPEYGAGWVSAYCTVCVPRDAGAVSRHLEEAGIENRRWWQDGVHSLAAYRGFTSDDLTITAELAARALSLPFSHDLTDAQITRVVDCLRNAIHRVHSG